MDVVASVFGLAASGMGSVHGDARPVGVATGLQVIHSAADE